MDIIDKMSPRELADCLDPPCCQHALEDKGYICRFYKGDGTGLLVSDRCIRAIDGDELCWMTYFEWRKYHEKV